MLTVQNRMNATSAPEQIAPATFEQRPWGNRRTPTTQVLVRIRIQGTTAQEAHFVATIPIGTTPTIDIRVMPMD